MENELLIKGILIRWLHSTTTSGEKINFSNAAKTVNDIGIQVEVTPEFKKLVKELIAEYNAPDVSFKTLLEKYPFVKIVPKGEAEEVTQKVVEKSEDELKEIIREQFLKVVKKRSDMFGMTAWNQVKQTLLEAYPELNDKKAKLNRLGGEIMEELEQNRPEFNEEDVEQQEDLFEEEVEINELSKSTLGSYLTKKTDEYMKGKTEPGTKEHAKDIQNMGKAYDKLKKEDVEQQDEAMEKKTDFMDRQKRLAASAAETAKDPARLKRMSNIPGYSAAMDLAKKTTLGAKHTKEEVEQEEYTFADYLEAARAQYVDEDAVLVANEAFKNQDITLFANQSQSPEA